VPSNVAPREKTCESWKTLKKQAKSSHKGGKNQALSDVMPGKIRRRGGLKRKEIDRKTACRKHQWFKGNRSTGLPPRLGRVGTRRKPSKPGDSTKRGIWGGGALPAWSGLYKKAWYPKKTGLWRLSCPHKSLGRGGP